MEFDRYLTSGQWVNGSMVQIIEIQVFHRSSPRHNKSCIVNTSTPAMTFKIRPRPESVYIQKYPQMAFLLRICLTLLSVPLIKQYERLYKGFVQNVYD